MGMVSSSGRGGQPEVLAEAIGANQKENARDEDCSEDEVKRDARERALVWVSQLPEMMVVQVKGAC